MLEKGPRVDGMIRYKWQNGLPFLGDAYGGITLPQVYCSPVSTSLKHEGVRFSDDVIFGKDKKGLFQLVVLLRSLAELDAARTAIHGLEKLSNNYVLPQEATFIVQASNLKGVPGCIANDVFRLATGGEFAATESLCKGRPAPKFYDMYRMRKDLYGQRYAIIRPDRFVYAACNTPEQLQVICEGIERTLGLVV